MGSYNAFYVRKKGDEDVVRRGILALYPAARIQMLPCFIGALLSRHDFEPPEQKLAELSATVATDVIWVGYQTTAECFIFHHWCAGQLMRALQYAGAAERPWGRAEGTAEAWEQEEFWSEDALAALLEYAETDQDRRQLEGLWKEKIIRKGETHPALCSEDTAHAVFEHYGLYGLDPEDAPADASSAAQESVKERLFRILLWAAIIGAIGLLIRKL